MRAGKSNHAGFTLVELLVAMVIGLIMLGAVIGLYVTSSQTAKFQSGLLRVEENGRFATDMISRTIRMAGYDDPLDDSEDSPTTVVELPTPYMSGTNNSGGTLFTMSNLKSTGDTIAVRYQGGTDIRDCQGRPVGSNEWVTSQYGITTGSNLVCATQDMGGTTIDGVTIAEGVEDMLILYGLDTDNDGFANRYVNASGVNNWASVVSVRVMLLVNSVFPSLGGNDTVCLGCTNFAGSNDRLIRAQYETTIQIRNQAPS